MQSALGSPSPIKLLAVGWSAIRALENSRNLPAEQHYIALSNDAVVLRASTADHKLFLWQDPSTLEYRNTIVDKQPSISYPSDGLAHLIKPRDPVFLITGFGQDTEAAQAARLAQQAFLAGGRVTVIGSVPKGPGYTSEHQTALSQINLLNQYLFPPATVTYERDLLLRQSNPDMAIIELYTIVDRMLLKTVQRIVDSHNTAKTRWAGNCLPL